jgi:hypothetical protein
MSEDTNQKYPKFPVVASLPGDQQRVRDFIAQTPGSEVVYMYPIEYDDGSIDFFPVALS